MPPKRASLRVSNRGKVAADVSKSPRGSTVRCSGRKSQKKAGKVADAKEIGGKSKSEEVGGGDRRKSANRGQSQSCHQCRQSIHSSKGVSEVKSGRERIKCSTCTRFW